MMASSKRILVAGDVCKDWYIRHREDNNNPVNQRRKNFDIESKELPYSIPGQLGGFVVLGEMIQKCVVSDVKIADNYDRDNADNYFNYYHMLYPYSSEKDQEKDKSEAIWRFHAPIGFKKPVSGNSAHREYQATDKYDIVVFDDKDLGFNHDPKHWEKMITNAQYIIYRTKKYKIKIFPEVEQVNPLWECILKAHKDNTIAIMTANDICQHFDIYMTQELSWDKTLRELMDEFERNPSLAPLRHFAHVVITFDMDGAILISRVDEKRIFRVFHMPDKKKGNIEQGNMLGFTFCITAAITSGIVEGFDVNNISNGVKVGLKAMKKLYKMGYDFDEFTGELRFPSAKIAKDLKKLAVELITKKQGFGVCEILIKAETGSLLENIKNDAMQFAHDIVLNGVSDSLSDIPHLEFNKLTVTNPNEVEGLSIIKNLISDYRKQNNNNKPLSLAVFGHPGSGKSFYVEQLAEHLDSKSFEVISFNLSQFHDPNQLHGAFHQVRDARLKGKIPLVLWDEFDSSLNGVELGWLRYFLSPMQDGTFLEGQVTHPIGKSVFIFSGGTSVTLENFIATSKGSIAAKGPDFISRLKGFLNISGPNPAGYEDDLYVIRRAILLRTYIERHAKHLIKSSTKEEENNKLAIDDAVLNAFLHRENIFSHGARSLESIIVMSRLIGKNKFERSSLPPLGQLRLHVEDADTFLRCVKDYNRRESEFII